MAERNNLGQTPLHVAAYWPRGLELLFELAEDACRHIIDAKDATKLTAIHSAIVLHQADSVEFLLKQGATIDLENTAIFFGHPEASDYYYQSQEVFDILSSELSSRRRKMLLFARENLAEKRLSEIGLQELNILQENAFKVLQVLKTIDVEIPSIFWTVRPGSIYHSPIMNAQLAEALYRAGFDRVNSIANGCNPLATINIAESSLRRDFGDLMGSVAWFERHGVDIKHPIPVFRYGSKERVISSLSTHTTIHRLAAGFGSAAPYFLLFHDRRPYSWRNCTERSSLANILSDSSRDTCKCFCSARGCSPASIFAKPWRKYIGTFQPIRTNFVLKFMWDIVSDMWTLSRQEHRQPLSDFVRVTTFDDLGMSHSCCEHKFHHFLRSIDIQTIYDPTWMTDPHEVAEIQEEDQHLADTLEQLMEDFDARLKEPSIDLANFWLYWRKRMKEAEEAKEEMGYEDIRAIREIGINLE